jgi:hypothetical protein
MTDPTPIAQPSPTASEVKAITPITTVADATAITPPIATSNDNLISDNKSSAVFLLGATPNNVSNTFNAPNYLQMSRFVAFSTGYMTQFKVMCSGTGNIKVGIYSDYAGEPDKLLNAIQTSHPVTLGANILKFPPTLLNSGERYWLAFCTDSSIMRCNKSGGTARCRSMPFGAAFPILAGNGFVNGTTCDLISGWGSPPPTSSTLPVTTNCRNLYEITSYGNGVYYLSGPQYALGMALAQLNKEQGIKDATIIPYIIESDTAGYFIITKIPVDTNETGK